MVDNAASAKTSITTSRLRAMKTRRATKAALSNAQKSHDSYYITRRKTRSAAKQFPFLRLPAELRSNVYTHVLKAFNRCTINSFRPQPLLQVSQLIRSESIGLPTTVNKVDMTIRSSYIVHAKTAMPSMNTDDIGVLQINSVVRNWIASNGASFRNLKIIVNCACCTKNSLIGEFHIVLPQNSQRYVVSAEMHPSRNDQRLSVLFGGIQREIERVLGEAAAKNGRLEMELSDLEAVAACFRWTEEQGKAEEE